MKYFYILFAFFPLNLFAQNTIVDSTFTENCITNTSSGDVFNDVHINSVSSTYNSSGQLISRVTIVTYLRDGVVSYSNSTMDSLIYDSAANTIETLSGTYINSVFTPQRGRIVTYDSGGLMISQVIAQVYPTYDLRYYYTNLPNGLIDYYYRVMNYASPDDSMFTELTYDASWNKIREESSVWDSGMILRPYEMQLLYYNASNQLIAYNWYQWISPTVGYDPCSRDTATFTYNASGLLTDEWQHFCGAGTITSWYTYDVNDNLVSSGFTDVTHSGYTSSQSCDAGTSVILNTGASVSSTGRFLVYPNPSSGRVELKGNFSHAINEIKITDLSGRIVSTKKVTMTKDSTFEVDLSELRSGVYVMQVFDGGVRSVLFVRE